MYGLIFMGLRKYVDANLGANKWNNLLTESGIGSKIYSYNSEYQDHEAVALVSMVSKLTGKTVPAILEEFGEFITPELFNMYRLLIKPEWRTLDLIEHTEETIHKTVRMKNPGAKPPELKVSRLNPNEVVITYSSQRKMCGIAKGIAKGVAKHYREQLSIVEPSCMLRGDANCKISIKVAK